MLLEFLSGASVGDAISLRSSIAAAAWGRDVIYTDSFGNLVIESAAGYKRILVDEGHEAARMKISSDAGQPEHTYDAPENLVAAQGEGHRPVLVKGRSCMCGFDQGEIPLQGGPCR